MPKPEMSLPELIATQEAARAQLAVNIDAAQRCTMCDDDGYRNRAICDHVDRSEIHERGMTRIREVLERVAQRKAERNTPPGAA